MIGCLCLLPNIGGNVEIYSPTRGSPSSIVFTAAAVYHDAHATTVVVAVAAAASAAAASELAERRT